MAAEGIGYIKVSRFAKTTTEELRKALDDLKKKGMRDLVLDLQDNGGGMLSAAIDMCDEFLDKDKLIVFTKGRAFPEEKTNAKPRIKGRFEEGRLVVLIDESSWCHSRLGPWGYCWKKIVWKRIGSTSSSITRRIYGSLNRSEVLYTCWKMHSETLRERIGRLRDGLFEAIEER
jgi:hypothetical protein